MLEKFAVQSLVEHDGELIFSMEKFAELIINECAQLAVTFNNNLQSLNDKEMRSNAVRVGDYVKERMK